MHDVSSPIASEYGRLTCILTLLGPLLSATPDPKYMAEHKQAVENAKKLLEKVNRG